MPVARTCSHSSPQEGRMFSLPGMLCWGKEGGHGGMLSCWLLSLVNLICGNLQKSSCQSYCKSVFKNGLQTLTQLKSFVLQLKFFTIAVLSVLWSRHCCPITAILRHFWTVALLTTTIFAHDGILKSKMISWLWRGDLFFYHENSIFFFSSKMPASLTDADVVHVISDCAKIRPVTL